MYLLSVIGVHMDSCIKADSKVCKCHLIMIMSDALYTNLFSVLLATFLSQHNLRGIATQMFFTHLSLASFLRGIEYRPRCDTAEHDIPSGTILLTKRIFNEK